LLYCEQLSNSTKNLTLHDLFVLLQTTSLLACKSTIEVCHCVFLQKNRDNLLELLCDNLFRVVVLEPLMFCNYIAETLHNIFVTLYLCMVEDGPFKGLKELPNDAWDKRFRGFGHIVLWMAILVIGGWMTSLNLGSPKNWNIL
jgi:hypothetical protein